MAPTPAYRIALVIHEHLTPQPSTIQCQELPDAAWSKCQSLRRQLHLAHSREWRLAARRLDRDYRSQLQAFADQMARLTSGLAHGATAGIATARGVYEDILSLHAEFDDVAWSKLQGTLCVTTEDIVLEGVALGRFQIQLDWRELPATCFRVIALDPNPAASNEDVTHPHVEHDSLCVGDARLPIQRALEQGRIADFFQIINSVLLTYNSGSPYVSLADWNGVSCSDCGDSVDSDGRYTCEKCEHCLCESCYRYCEACSCYFCCECVARCEGCEEDVCHCCQQSCKSCRDTFCPGCLEENLCDNCQQESTEAAALPASERTAGDSVGARATNADIAIHADRLGKVAVPA
ncbi:MAG: hypothetical protein H8E66_25330 [Planctomycetes bacterium]|nr:hypothetical protein [Planctomycetota bacterium]